MIELSNNQPHSWGTPNEEELAAIVAALEQTWPRNAEVVAKPHTPVWRFSGRWW